MSTVDVVLIALFFFFFGVIICFRIYSGMYLKERERWRLREEVLYRTIYCQRDKSTIARKTFDWLLYDFNKYSGQIDLIAGDPRLKALIDEESLLTKSINGLTLGIGLNLELDQELINPFVQALIFRFGPENRQDTIYH